MGKDIQSGRRPEPDASIIRTAILRTLVLVNCCVRCRYKFNTFHFAVNQAGRNTYYQRYCDGNDRVGPDRHGISRYEIFNINHHAGSSYERDGCSKSVCHLGECTQDKGSDQNTEHESHKAVEPFIGRFYSAVCQYHGYDDGEDTHDQRYILSNFCLLFEAQLLLRETFLDIQSPA